MFLGFASRRGRRLGGFNNGRAPLLYLIGLAKGPLLFMLFQQRWLETACLYFGD
jgi:hypothetical protein